MLEKASFCHAPAHATCSAEIPSAELQKFDLHPPQAEKALMGFMYLQVARRDRNLMREILSGAHLQYGIPQGEVLHTILLGRIGKTTWLQFEGNGVNGMVSFFFHMCDYLEYKECPLMCNITSGASQTVLPYRAMTSTGSWHQLLRRLRRTRV
eukprot:g23199.t1